MRIATLCSGIGAAKLAAKNLGWENLWSAEIDAFPAAVLAHHYPESKNFGDVAKIRGDEDGLGKPDVIVFGSPCQAFSVAGRREGMDDPRGNITLECLRVVSNILPKWVVFENVPGLLSIDGGRTFGTILGIFRELGYGFAYRVLDAQFFGVPQRRRRVFVVGCLGDWRGAATVLFEQESLFRDLASGAEEGEGIAERVAGSLGSNHSGSGERYDLDSMGAYIPEVSKSIRSNSGGIDREDMHTLIPTFWDGGQVAQTIDAVTSKGQTMPEKNRFPAVLVPRAVNVEHGLSNCGNLRLRDVTQPITSSEKNAHTALLVSAKADPISAHEQRTYTHEGSTFRLRSVIPTVNPLAFSCKDSGLDIGKVSPPLRAMNSENSNQNSGGQVAIAFQSTLGSRGGDIETGGKTPPLRVGSGVGIPSPPAVAFQPHGVKAPPLTASNDPSRSPQSQEVTKQVLEVYRQTLSVRRLTPRECERLQGFPDDYTLIPYKGSLAKDSHRYKAIGNSMAVPVVEWILRRIQMVDEILSGSGE